MPALMVSHDPNHNVVPHFNCLDLRNAVVSLTTLLVSCDTNTSANGVNGDNSDVAPYFNCLDLRSAVMPFLIPLALCDTNKSANVVPHFD